MSKGVVVVPCSLKAANVEAPRVAPTVQQLVQGAGVAVEGDHDLVVGAEELLELLLRSGHADGRPAGQSASGRRR